MATLRQSVTGDDRTDPRYPILRGLDAWVEVNLAGRCWCLPILEMSETPRSEPKANVGGPLQEKGRDASSHRRSVTPVTNCGPAGPRDADGFAAGLPKGRRFSDAFAG